MSVPHDSLIFVICEGVKSGRIAPTYAATANSTSTPIMMLATGMMIPMRSPAETKGGGGGKAGGGEGGGEGGGGEGGGGDGGGGEGGGGEGGGGEGGGGEG
eukprot:6751354-Prymnesium_polylepis.4